MKKIIFLISTLIFSLNTIYAQSELWGMAYGGGDGIGVIYKTDGNGDNLQVVRPFPQTKGKVPQGDLCQSSNGKFYGMTSLGGANNLGVLFEYDPATLIYAIKVDFAGLSNGSKPLGSLLQAANGKLYGMTSTGGSNDKGTIFEYDPLTSTFSIKYNFDGALHGSSPKGSLMQASNGKLYGMTYDGGSSNKGVLFEYDTATSILTKILDFTGSSKGCWPYGSLLQASNGKVYGMTSSGGTHASGILFEYDLSTSTFTQKVDFDGTLKGKRPEGSLIQATNGKLYGMTSLGGTYDLGVLFEFDPSTSTFTKKINFDGLNYGDSPYGSLIQASNGKLYGMTYDGGSGDATGVLFEYNPVTSKLTKKIDFSAASKISHPYGSLIESSNGKLYGMTSLGGANNCGLIIEYDFSISTYTKIIEFNSVVKGSSPKGSLILASNNKFYGLTSLGGANNLGVLFEYDPATLIYAIKVDFAGLSNGSQPFGSLLQASNGKLYGMTSSGGSNDKGTIFEYDPLTSTFSIKYIFDGSSNGSYPQGSLVQAFNGKLYGLTYDGGSYNDGVLFEYIPSTNTVTSKVAFNGASMGKHPYGSLIQSLNGKLYGMAEGGGANNFGVLFEFDQTTSAFSTKIDFDGTSTGSSPYGSLTQYFNGKLYGMTTSGGVNYSGVLFEYDPATSIYTKKIDFEESSKGALPNGSLLQAPNGKLYGTTVIGGVNSKGVLFEYDPSTSTYTKKLDFNDANGSKPYGDLISLNICSKPSIISQPFNRSKCVGDSVKFMVAATSNCTLNYQWRINGSDINGATDSSYIISNTATTDNGNYSCFVSTSSNNTISNDASLTVNPIPIVNLGKDTILTAKQSITLDVGSGFVSYLWSNGKSTQTIKIDSNGIGLKTKLFWVKVKDNSCFGYDSINITFTKGISINDPSLNYNIKIYPNPCYDFIMIESNLNSNDLTVSILDINGKFIKMIDNKAIGNIINIYDIPKGIFFINFRNNNVSKFIKLIKY